MRHPSERPLAPYKKHLLTQSWSSYAPGPHIFPMFCGPSLRAVADTSLSERDFVSAEKFGRLAGRVHVRPPQFFRYPTTTGRRCFEMCPVVVVPCCCSGLLVTRMASFQANLSHHAYLRHRRSFCYVMCVLHILHTKYIHRVTEQT